MGLRGLGLSLGFREFGVWVQALGFWGSELKQAVFGLRADGVVPGAQGASGWKCQALYEAEGFDSAVGAVEFSRLKQGFQARG